MKCWYHTFDKAFSAPECAELIAFAHGLPAQAGVIGHGAKAETHEMRRSTVRWLPTDSAQLLPLTLKLKRMLHVANQQNFGVDWQDFSDLQFTEYNASNSGHYDWHEDNTWIQRPESPLWDRKLSIVVQLSHGASYEGGKLELDRGGLAEGKFCGQGDVIVFPSFLRHRVTPVTSWVRYSLVAWAQGPRWK